MKILTINKTRLRHASHIKIMERFLTRLAKLTIEHEAHTEYRKAFTDAFDKESGLYVTPHVGVWIETVVNNMGEAKSVGHSPRGSVD